jgi:hypothetical protein
VRLRLNRTSYRGDDLMAIARRACATEGWPTSSHQLVNFCNWEGKCFARAGARIEGSGSRLFFQVWIRKGLGIEELGTLAGDVEAAVRGAIRARRAGEAHAVFSVHCHEFYPSQPLELRLKAKAQGKARKRPAPRDKQEERELRASAGVARWTKKVTQLEQRLARARASLKQWEARYRRAMRKHAPELREKLREAEEAFR